MIICLSLVVLTGFVGQISLAQMAFAGHRRVLALSKLSRATGRSRSARSSAGALVAALFGLLVALPALRVRGVNLAIVTLAFAVAIESIVFKNPTA